MKYPVIIYENPIEEGGGYCAAVSHLPGCLGVGDTVAEAYNDAVKASEEWLYECKRLDRKVPPEPDMRVRSYRHAMPF